MAGSPSPRVVSDTVKPTHELIGGMRRGIVRGGCAHIDSSLTREASDSCHSGQVSWLPGPHRPPSPSLGDHAQVAGLLAPLGGGSPVTVARPRRLRTCFPVPLTTRGTLKCSPTGTTCDGPASNASRGASVDTTPVLSPMVWSARWLERTTDMSCALHDGQAWIFWKGRIGSRALAPVEHRPTRRLDALHEQAVSAESHADRLVVQTFRLAHPDTILLGRGAATLKRYSASRAAISTACGAVGRVPS